MKKIFLFSILSFLFSCKERVNETNRSEPEKLSVYIDKPFIQEYHEGYIISKNSNEPNDVRSIQPDENGNVWIATKAGVYQKTSLSREWKLMIDGSDKGSAFDVKMDGKGKIWVASWNGVYSNSSGKLEKIEGLTSAIAKVVCVKEGIYALGPYGIWLYKNNAWEKKNYKTARSIRAAVSDGNGGLWIGTDVGLYHCNDIKTTVFQKNEDLISAYVSSMAYNDQDELWVASMGGITIRNEKGKIGEILPKDGITNAFVNVVRKAPDGKMWVGSNYGITRFIPGEKEYSVRLTKRWLINDEVRDIAFDNGS
jgi:ligand-binding sensor domain-containing protein